MTSRAEDYAEFPYPGERPAGSYLLDADGSVRRLIPDLAVASGWRLGTRDLDTWLRARGAAPLEERVAVLSFGSNANPLKVLRNRVSLPAVQLAAEVVDLASVWCAGTRELDGAVPATLAPCQGHRERHVVSYVLPEDVAVLDRVEGHPHHYVRELLPTGSVVLEDGVAPRDVIAYVGLAPDRVPLLGEDGDPVAVHDGRTLTQAQAQAQSLLRTMLDA